MAELLRRRLAGAGGGVVVRDLVLALALAGQEVRGRLGGGGGAGAEEQSLPYGKHSEQYGHIVDEGYATDHTIVRVYDIALAFVLLDDAVMGREQLFSFLLFAALSELFAGAPSHAMKNDAGFVLWHLAIFVNDSSCEVAFLSGVTRKHMDCTVLSISLVAAMEDVFDSLFVLEADVFVVLVGSVAVVPVLGIEICIVGAAPYGAEGVTKEVEERVDDKVSCCVKNDWPNLNVRSCLNRQQQKTLNNSASSALAWQPAQSPESRNIVQEMLALLELLLQLREVLASAAQDGSLGRALAVPAEPEMADDEKEILRLQLESSLERGALAAALAEETEVIERDLEEVRPAAKLFLSQRNGLRMQSMLVQSLRDGALDAALQAVFSEQDQEDTRTIIAEQDLGITEDTEVECLRVRLAHQLQTSMMDGSLDAALAELTVESLDELRQRAASLLQSSFDNGQLQFVLSSRATEAAEAESLLALRSQAASQLLTALNDGSLEKALENTRSQDELRDRRLESLRHKVAGTLENALMDGSLQAALWNKEARKRDKEIVEDTKPSSEKHEGDVDALRQKAAVLLTTSCADDGSLEAALSSKASRDLEGIRNEVATLLEAATNDGSLEMAVKAVAGARSTEDEIESVRKKIAFRLQQSASDGTLGAALLTASRPESSEDLLFRMGQQLSEAFLDGTLEAALEATRSGDVPPARDNDDNMDHLKSMVAESLSSAFWDGSLEAALEASGSPPREQELGSQSTGKACAATIRASQDLLGRDNADQGRIGKLLEGIEASEREILARSQQMAMLQASLELAWDKQQLALEREEANKRSLLALTEESRTLRER
ncbi:Creatine kinase B-type [Durusdinium trenchii]|uniref:Creatine kinase B-type n=1 Tax=Durusdinium trenchii TaxID=1381693 RepID=A0ABP0MCI2_9DINO